MKLRNKKTGAIYKIEDIDLGSNADGIWLGMTKYTSLAEFNEEWEDYKEPMYYFVADTGEIKHEPDRNDDADKFSKRIGNYFNTWEEANDAMEKLKAWKRLRDKGIKVIDRGWEKINNINREDDGVIYIKVLFDTKTYDDSWDDDLDLLFGDEE